jgi:hypothetical protein
MTRETVTIDVERGDRIQSRIAPVPTRRRPAMPTIRGLSPTGTAA